MKKTVSISGMSCSHCSSSIEKALNSIDGIHAEVDLEKNCAFLTLNSNVSDDLIKKTVEHAGYTVTNII